ncbi:Tapetum determinant 1 [Heracleum sosnowskyi]|uniref:Tapetum determinant 1 n=1 Tax=Heracleum sosnowskyi TaxID=360622 RepID=A0AAD8MP12_9APIA|nr:Tapetum determinant 1 [Heracleum sosnowskyi]
MDESASVCDNLLIPASNVITVGDSSSTGVGAHEERINIFKVNQTSSIASRPGSNGSDVSCGSVKQIGPGCSKSSIDVFQGQTPPLPNGIPTYTVTVKNICDTGCTISNIHLSYGWFSSLRTINPSVFRRLSYNDCLVNDGKPLGPGKTITFQYANTFSYPLAVSSITCI